MLEHFWLSSYIALEHEIPSRSQLMDFMQSWPDPDLVHKYVTYIAEFEFKRDLSHVLYQRFPEHICGVIINFLT